jgi:predicted nucleic acid-binding protein
MHELAQAVVTNTTPLIALTAATGSLEALRFLYSRVVVPYEVAQEIRVGGRDTFGVDVFESASWLEIGSAPVALAPYLQNALDRGEASVIQTALDLGLQRVCIDEALGRRIARLSNLSVTGSIGVLVKAKSLGYVVSIPEALERMRERGIWLSQDVVRFALAQ